MLYVLLVLLLLNLFLFVKVLVLVNEIKKYQYINNLKMLGFIEKKFSRFYEELGKVVNFKRKWGDKNVNK